MRVFGDNDDRRLRVVGQQPLLRQLYAQRRARQAPLPLRIAVQQPGKGVASALQRADDLSRIVRPAVQIHAFSPHLSFVPVDRARDILRVRQPPQPIDGPPEKQPIPDKLLLSDPEMPDPAGEGIRLVRRDNDQVLREGDQAIVAQQGVKLCVPYAEIQQLPLPDAQRMPLLLPPSLRGQDQRFRAVPFLQEGQKDLACREAVERLAVRRQQHPAARVVQLVLPPKGAHKNPAPVHLLISGQQFRRDRLSVQFLFHALLQSFPQPSGVRPRKESLPVCAVRSVYVTSHSIMPQNTMLHRITSLLQLQSPRGAQHTHEGT